MQRRALLGLGLALAADTVARPLYAMGRLPLGGSLNMRVPHDTARLDPHDLTDPMAAIVGAAVFEPVFRLDPQGNPYPSLAQGLPVRDGAQVRVTLREGLRSARGKAIDARDLVSSVERARAKGAAALLAGISKPSVQKGQTRTAVFRDVDPGELARVLSSPLVALTARTSTPGAPDGTGAFRAEPSADRLVLTRNRNAARGPSFLEQITLQRAADLGEPLRAFEAHQVDVGWLGGGYYQQRADSVPFDFGSAAWIVLRTGNDAKTWNGPGVAQRLIDGIPPARLAHLAIGTYTAESGAMTWGGEPCEMLAPSHSPHLVEVARSMASILSVPGHEVTATSLADAELDRRRKAGAFALMVDLVRPVGPAGIATLIALATADDPSRARSIVRAPPKLASFAPRVLARTLRLGVIGDLRVAGATLHPVHLARMADGAGWDLGNSYRLTG